MSHRDAGSRARTLLTRVGATLLRTTGRHGRHSMWRVEGPRGWTTVTINDKSPSWRALKDNASQVKRAIAKVGLAIPTVVEADHGTRESADAELERMTGLPVYNGNAPPIPPPAEAPPAPASEAVPSEPAPVVTAEAAPPEEETPMATHYKNRKAPAPCPECGRTFDSLKGWAFHRSKTHGVAGARQRWPSRKGGKPPIPPALAQNVDVTALFDEMRGLLDKLYVAVLAERARFAKLQKLRDALMEDSA